MCLIMQQDWLTGNRPVGVKKKPVRKIHRLDCTTYMLIELYTYSVTEDAVYLTDCSICAFS